MQFLDKIRRNAQNGRGSCKGCPANEATGGEFVNPGLFEFDADIMFVTMDPSHDPHWDRHESWTDYNKECMERFKGWSGYDPLTYLLKPLGLSLNDIWLADSIKCPVDNVRRRVSDGEIAETFEHCRQYLREEVELVNPLVIVAFGADSAERVLAECHGVDISLHPGHADCGRTFESPRPPIIVSPHWFHGWLGRQTDGKKNVDIVRDELVRLYEKEQS